MCFLCPWVLYYINSNDFNTIFDLSYEKLCLKIFLYQGLMLKIQKASNIYIMFMVGGITCNYICQVF